MVHEGGMSVKDLMSVPMSVFLILRHNLIEIFEEKERRLRER